MNRLLIYLYRKPFIYEKIVLVLFIALIASTKLLYAQTHEDSVIVKLNALRDDFVGKIKKLGLTPSLKVPPILLDNPRSFGNYNGSLNVIHTSNWETTPKEIQDFFGQLASGMEKGMSGQKLFELAVHQWIFVYELGHWWRAC